MSLRAIVRLRFQWRSKIARSRRLMWASSARNVYCSDGEAIPKKPCHPRSQPLIWAMQLSSLPPQLRGRELADPLHRAPLGALRQQNLHGPALRI